MYWILWLFLAVFPIMGQDHEVVEADFYFITDVGKEVVGRRLSESEKGSVQFVKPNSVNYYVLDATTIQLLGNEIYFDEQVFWESRLLLIVNPNGYNGDVIAVEPEVFIDLYEGLIVGRTQSAETYFSFLDDLPWKEPRPSRVIHPHECSQNHSSEPPPHHGDSADINSPCHGTVGSSGSRCFGVKNNINFTLSCYVRDKADGSGTVEFCTARVSCFDEGQGQIVGTGFTANVLSCSTRASDGNEIIVGAETGQAVGFIKCGPDTEFMLDCNRK